MRATQGFDVREQRLLQGLGTPTRAGRVPREAERLEPATLAEGVEREELWLRGAVRSGEQAGIRHCLAKEVVGQAALQIEVGLDEEH
jgi:hypothetical protein